MLALFLSTAALLSLSSLSLSLSLSLHVSFYQFLQLPTVLSFQVPIFLWLGFPSCTVLKVALIMNLNESFWQISKKKKDRKKIESFNSSWTCPLALLQRWRGPMRTPRVHISTTSLITRSCWQCHVLPAAM